MKDSVPRSFELVMSMWLGLHWAALTHALAHGCPVFGFIHFRLVWLKYFFCQDDRSRIKEFRSSHPSVLAFDERRTMGPVSPHLRRPCHTCEVRNRDALCQRQCTDR